MTGLAYVAGFASALAMVWIVLPSFSRPLIRKSERTDA